MRGPYQLFEKPSKEQRLQLQGEHPDVEGGRGDLDWSELYLVRRRRTNQVSLERSRSRFLLAGKSATNPCRDIAKS